MEISPADSRKHFLSLDVRNLFYSMIHLVKIVFNSLQQNVLNFYFFKMDKNCDKKYHYYLHLIVRVLMDFSPYIKSSSVWKWRDMNLLFNPIKSSGGFSPLIVKPQKHQNRLIDIRSCPRLIDDWYWFLSFCVFVSSFSLLKLKWIRDIPIFFKIGVKWT